MEPFTLPAYQPQNLIVHVLRYPSKMSQDLRDKLKVLFELHLKSLRGMFGGVTLHTGGDRMSTLVPQHMPRVELIEREGKIVMHTLLRWLNLHVNGLTRKELERDGLELLIVEPNAYHTGIVDAWHLTGVYPKSSGNPPAKRDLANAQYSTEGIVYDIELGGTVHYNGQVLEMGREWFAGLHQHDTLTDSATANN